MGKFNLSSEFFKSFKIEGDKITIHKSVIDAAIKQVKNDPDPFESSDRTAGRIDVLEDLTNAIWSEQKRRAEIIF